MRVSDLQLSDKMEKNSYAGHRVETLTDSYLVINNRKSLRQYTDEFGDVEIEYDAEFGVYRVPAFFDKRAKYSEAKQVYCDRYGCE